LELRSRKSFSNIEKAFTIAPILIYPDFSKPFFMETNASNFALGAMLSQPGENGKLHPIAFHSKKFNATKINYEIYDKELLAIVNSFQ